MTDLVSIREASEIRGVSITTIKNRIKDGLIPIYPDDKGQVWLDREDLQIIETLYPYERRKEARIILKKYPRSDPNYRKGFVEAKSGKNGYGKTLKKWYRIVLNSPITITNTKNRMVKKLMQEGYQREDIYIDKSLEGY